VNPDNHTGDIVVVDVMVCGGGYICNDFSVGGLFLRMQWKSSWWESVDTVCDEV